MGREANAFDACVDERSARVMEHEFDFRTLLHLPYTACVTERDESNEIINLDPWMIKVEEHIKEDGVRIRVKGNIP